MKKETLKILTKISSLSNDARDLLFQFNESNKECIRVEYELNSFYKELPYFNFNTFEEKISESFYLNQIREFLPFEKYKEIITRLDYAFYELLHKGFMDLNEEQPEEAPKQTIIWLDQPYQELYQITTEVASKPFWEKEIEQFIFSDYSQEKLFQEYIQNDLNNSCKKIELLREKIDYIFHNDLYKKERLLNYKTRLSAIYPKEGQLLKQIAGKVIYFGLRDPDDTILTMKINEQEVINFDYVTKNYLSLDEHQIIQIFLNLVLKSLYQKGFVFKIGESYDCFDIIDFSLSKYMQSSERNRFSPLKEYQEIAPQEIFGETKIGIHYYVHPELIPLMEPLEIALPFWEDDVTSFIFNKHNFKQFLTHSDQILRKWAKLKEENSCDNVLNVKP